jgi:predicted acylesterase/phospholipase RssA
MDKPNNIIDFQPNILVISGGGSKGIAFVGVLTAFRNKTNFDINKIKILTGSSIGGVICFAICSGYTLDEIKQWFLSTNFSVLCPALYDEKYSQKILPLLYKYYSLGNDDEIKKILINVFIFKKYNYQTLTFEELYKKTGKLLVLSGSNLNLKKCDYFSYIKTPKMKIFDALLITTRIPYIFPYIKYNDYVYVDGHIFDPFPIKGCGKMNIKENKNKIIGIRSVSENTNIKIENIKDFTISIIEGLSHQYTKKIINKYKKHIVSVEIDTDFFNLNINFPKLNEMFNKGLVSGVSYIDSILI